MDSSTYIPGENQIRPGSYQRHVNADAVEAAETQTPTQDDESEYLNAWLVNGNLVIVQRTAASGPAFSVQSAEYQGNLLMVEGDAFKGTEFALNLNGELEVTYT